MHHPWNSSGPVLMGPWATYLVEGVPPVAGGCAYVIFKAPSNPNHSRILWNRILGYDWIKGSRAMESRTKKSTHYFNCYYWTSIMLLKDSYCRRVCRFVECIFRIAVAEYIWMHISHLLIKGWVLLCGLISKYLHRASQWTSYTAKVPKLPFFFFTRQCFFSSSFFSV